MIGVERVPYVEAGAAMRQAIRRAIEHRAGDRKLRVLLVVIELTASYSRLTARTYLWQVAANVHNVETTTRDQRKDVGEDLRWLAGRGVIGLEGPGSGRPRRGAGSPAYIVSLPSATENGGHDNPNYENSNDVNTGHDNPQVGVTATHKWGSQQPPVSSSSSEESSEEKENTHTHGGESNFAGTANESARLGVEFWQQANGQWDVDSLVDLTSRRFCTLDAVWLGTLGGKWTSENDIDEDVYVELEDDPDLPTLAGALRELLIGFKVAKAAGGRVEVVRTNPVRFALRDKLVAANEWADDPAGAYCPPWIAATVEGREAAARRAEAKTAKERHREDERWRVGFHESSGREDIDRRQTLGRERN